MKPENNKYPDYYSLDKDLEVEDDEYTQLDFNKEERYINSDRFPESFDEDDRYFNEDEEEDEGGYCDDYI
jgi:hypothetical protein